MKQIEERLNALVSNFKDPLSNAMQYALFGGGKRIRPKLVLAATETLGADPLAAIDPACAIEMVHTYSLIHDDLPCMDDDDFRRGRPTVHRAFSEGIAVLAGDALLTEAFGTIARAKQLTNPQIVRLISILSMRIGKEGMVGGQAIDIVSQDASLEQIIKINERKTGDLFACCLEFGAIIANADTATEKAMRSIGLNLGQAYQILDDMQDDRDLPIGIDGLLDQTLKTIEQQLSALPNGGKPIKNLFNSIFATRVVESY